MGHERTSNKAEGKCGGLKTNSVMCRFVSETLARVHSPPMTLAAYGDWIDFRSKIGFFSDLMVGRSLMNVAMWNDDELTGT